MAHFAFRLLVLTSIAVLGFAVGTLSAQASQQAVAQASAPPRPTPPRASAHAAGEPAGAGRSPAQGDLASASEASAAAVPDTIPSATSLDYLSGYFTNLTSPVIVDGKPWDFGSTNMVQLQQSNGGVSYWDYWGESEPWDSPNHLWYDQQGQSHTYRSETIETAAGQSATAYVLFEKDGPGVMDKLWFTHDPTTSFMSVLSPANPLNNLLSNDPPDQTEWGDLSKLGNLRIEVDGQVVYAGPVEDWFSGAAQDLSPELQQILVWHYQQFGSDGNIIPVAYQNHIKVSVYGGSGKPKWFMATGLDLPPGTSVESYTGTAVEPTLAQMQQYSQNVLHPEQLIDTMDPQTVPLTVQSGTPGVLSFSGSGAVLAVQFKVDKKYDPRRLWLEVLYGDQIGLAMPLLAFFGEPDKVSYHTSTPIGLIDDGASNLFYSNLPMPYQKGIKIEVLSDDASPISLSAKVVDDPALKYDTQLRAAYKPSEQLTVNGPDYVVNLPGNGKMVALVLVTKDQGYDQVPVPLDPKTGKPDPYKNKWPMGYLEGNLTLTDGAGNTRYYSGQEDWAEGGYYFNSDFQAPPGGSNRPFGGLLSYQGGPNGYATLFRYFNDLSAFPFRNGLRLAFEHGTWGNNFPVSYGATVLYYHTVE
ncbi:MAG: DUF2961 domain-containing protein [Chloroflexi bacterium]|nr:DUF2961 domain-containing protein [Chloroflexota bacterium]